MKPGADASQRLPFASLLVLTALLQAVLWAVRPLVSYRALHMGADVFELGLLAGAFALLAVVAAVPAGRLADRRGERPVLLIGTLLFAGSALAMAWSPTLLVLAVVYALFGLGRVYGVVSIQAFVATLSSPRNQDARYGFQSVAASLGQVIGPAVGGFVAAQAQRGSATATVGEVGAGRVFLLAGVVALLALPLLLLLPARRPARSSTDGGASAAKTPLIDILQLPNMLGLLVASTAVMNGLDVLVAFLPPFGEAHGIPVEAIGVILSLRAIASVVSRLFTGTLVKRFGASGTLAYALIITGLAIGLVPVFPTTIAVGILLTLAGFGLGLGQPLTLAWIARITPPESRATAVALRLTGNRVAQVALMPLVGVAGGAIGLPAIFATLAAWLCLSGVTLRVRSLATPSVVDPDVADPTADEPRNDTRDP